MKSSFFEISVVNTLWCNKPTNTIKKFGFKFTEIFFIEYGVLKISNSLPSVLRKLTLVHCVPFQRRQRLISKLGLSIFFFMIQTMLRVLRYLVRIFAILHHSKTMDCLLLELTNILKLLLVQNTKSFNATIHCVAEVHLINFTNLRAFKDVWMSIKSAIVKIAFEWIDKDSESIFSKCVIETTYIIWLQS